MSRRGVLLVIAVVLILAGGMVFVLSTRKGVAPVLVKLRIEVVPADQATYVAGMMNSSRFKYLAGKPAGVGAAQAQKLLVKPLPNGSQIEAEAHLLNKEEAQKYAAGFLETLQLVCGTQAQVSVTEQVIK